MITDFEEFVTWMYVLIDDLWQQIGPVLPASGAIPGVQQ